MYTSHPQSLIFVLTVEELINKMLLIVLCFIALHLGVNNAGKLQVDVYYEALCPESIQFITNQLYPNYMNMAKYINLGLIPFGKATMRNSSGHWQFTCQHGPTECVDNMAHSCVLSHYSIPTSVEFINCAMRSNPYTNSSLQTCAKLTSVSWDSIDDCFETGEAERLLAENGIKTKSVSPPIKYIPTVIFNGIYNEKYEDEALDNFGKIVCLLLKSKPDFCKINGYFYKL